LEGVPKLRLTTPEQAELRGALTSYWLDAQDIPALRKALWETYRVEVPIITELPEGNLLRFRRISTTRRRRWTGWRRRRQVCCRCDGRRKKCCDPPLPGARRSR
jgi:hypothetical protein